ncbi:uncharacterized protein LOC133193119 [Saccostrea echinata]|uniref:uncharacterized protein LOC133193119 n=1 Tax=Saccostrea echinata TaxID=191078 RepID=UPI002A817E7E|nr:uncharacterized protein LOC133193119 [Saccostrea echinata]
MALVMDVTVDVSKDAVLDIMDPIVIGPVVKTVKTKSVIRDMAPVRVSVDGSHHIVMDALMAIMVKPVSFVAGTVAMALVMDVTVDVSKDAILDIMDSRCSSNCVGRECNRYGDCTQGCVQGYRGNKCQYSCPSGCSSRVCNRSNGFCFSCIDGYFGDRCEKDCRWKDKCSGRKCNKTNGFCLNGCNPGLYGNYCGMRCGNCSSGICDRNTGNCKACSVGFYGAQCNGICSNTCQNQECRQIDGHCSNGCDNGFYGPLCKKSCSENCAERKCRQNGGCIGGCTPNWTGDKCDRCDSGHYGRYCSQACSPNCKGRTCNNITGFCIFGCNMGFFLEKCERACSQSCPSACSRYSGECKGECPVGKYGSTCDRSCNQYCKSGCSKTKGLCHSGCIVGKFGADCLQTCGGGCISGCHQVDGSCSCKTGWQNQNCDVCKPDYYGQECDQQCSSYCINGTCLPNNGSCIGGCKGYFVDEQCTMAENKYYSTIRNVSVPIEDPEEEPQTENPEEAVYYNDLSVAKDIAVSNLFIIITHKEAKENEGFLKEFKSLPYGERFDCDIAKTEENMPKNRFKTTFPYDHSRVILEASQGFISDYINANYIENMEGKREFIACQGPLKNTLVDHWRMIWQEHVEYIVMLTNLIEGPKVKCHEYWPDKETELDINPFSVTLIEEKQYAYFVERRLTLRNKKVTGSRTVVQYHYTQWPDHGTPNPLNLVVFHRHFRHKVRSTQHPIIVHCSAGIGRTGTFIAFDVLSRYGKDKGKVNVIEYVKAMRKDRMTMIQNVDQYVFLYHALHEFFRGKAHYKKGDEILSLYGDMNKLDAQKQLTNEFNELISLKPRFDSKDFKTGKTFLKLNMTKSVLPVEQYLVYLTSHVPGRQCYYNAVTVSSFSRDDEFISAQFPVPEGAIDLVRLLVDHESTFLISLNPLSELKELQSWVDEKVNPLKLGPYTITKGTQEVVSGEIRKTYITITTKEVSCF